MPCNINSFEEESNIDFALHAAYSMYVAEWMKRISTDRLKNEIRICFEDADPFISWKENMLEYMDNQGIGGELFVCFDEFCGEEMLDASYADYLADGCKPLKEALDEWRILNGVDLV